MCLSDQTSKLHLVYILGQNMPGLSTLSALLLLSVVFSQKATFDTFDVNKDNAIDRTEFQAIDSLYIKYQYDQSAHQPHHFYDHFSFFSSSDNKSNDSELSFKAGFINSLAMIIATEIGDKTFFIAAIMAMHSNRVAVFLGSYGALILMTILSAFIGLALPAFLPRSYTHIIGGLLFLYFGVKLLYDSRAMESGKVSEELEEVEEELLHMASKKSDDDDDDDGNGNGNGNGINDVEDGHNTGFTPMKNTASIQKPYDKVFTQAFTLTFLAEWGDRSQIATIALAGARDPIGVTVGGCLGHGLCTGLAVVGGRILATSISEKTATIGGGIVFLLFGVHSLFFEEL